MSTVNLSFRTVIKRCTLGLLAGVFPFLVASSLSAQIVESGTITGVVRDNSGAVIPNAPVAVRNSGTGLATNLSTDSQGLYVSPPLNPGNYDVEVNVPGFSKVVEHVRLEVGQRVAADVALTVGATAETIEVQDTGTVLQSESASVGNLRTEEAVKDLPLNGRNFSELFSLGAGVVSTTTQGSSIAYTAQRGPSYFAINGSRPQENRTLLDGIGDQENHNSMAAVFPPIDAIQEFSEETQDADARYGRGNGGTINVVMKSGTDKYHGDVFEFLRNTALDARNYFNTPIAGPTGQRAALRQNEFGATFGGPVFYKQANPKTFFFADYAGKRFAQGQTNVESVPVVNITSAGYDFTNYFNQNPSLVIKNPLNKAITYTKANPIIPANTPGLDQTGINVLNFYQKYAHPNYGSANAIANNYFYGPLLIINEDDFDVKIDRKFSENDTAFIRYSQGHDIFSQPGILPNPLVGDVICGPASDPAHQAVISETHILSPTTINTVRFGWTRFFVYAKNWDAGLQLASPSNLCTSMALVAGFRANASERCVRVLPRPDHLRGRRNLARCGFQHSIGRNNAMQLRLNAKQISIGAIVGMQSLLLFGTLAVAQIPLPVKPPAVPRPAVKPPAPKPAAPAPKPAPKPATIPAAKPATVPAAPAAKPGTVPAASAPVVPPAKPPITGGRPPIGGRPQVVPAAANSGVPGRQPSGGGQGFNGRPPISGLAGQGGGASTAGGAPGASGAPGAGGSQAAGGSRSGVGGGNGQSLGTFPGCCGYTMTAYSCFRSGSQVLCDFDVSNQGNIRANAKQIYSDTHMVNGSGRVLSRTDAYFVDTDGSQFVDSQITPGNKVRMIMVFNNVPASTTSVSLAQGSNTIQSVAIANQEPGTADSTAEASHGAGQAGGGGPKAKQQ